MIRFVLVFTPSVPPLWYGRVTAACTASLSRSRPRVEACRWAGRSRGRRQSIPQGVRGCPGAGSRPLTSFQGSQHHLRPQGRADQGWLAEQERRDHGLPGTRARAENAAFRWSRPRRTSAVPSSRRSADPTPTKSSTATAKPLPSRRSMPGFGIPGQNRATCSGQGQSAVARPARSAGL